MNLKVGDVIDIKCKGDFGVSTVTIIDIQGDNVFNEHKLGIRSVCKIKDVICINQQK